MSKIDAELDIGMVIDSRIQELEGEKEKAAQIIKEADVKINELQGLLESLALKSAEVQKERVSNNIKKNTLKGLLPDERDARRVNVFLEYMEKCGDEPIYGNARKKMGSLEKHVYKKQSRLWNSWVEFREDFHRWVNREGPWAGILTKQGEDNNE